MKITIKIEPGIKVYSPAERFKAMIRHDNQAGPFITLLKYLTGQRVQFLVEIFDDADSVFKVSSGAEGWMGLVQIAEKHVLQAIRGFKPAGHQSFSCSGQGIEENFFCFLVEGIGQVQKGLLR